MSDWKQHGIRVVRAGELDCNTPQTPGMTRAAAIKKRESAMSTGIGFGIGLPHASTDAISEVVGTIGRSSEGIQFEAVDGQPVNLVLLFLVPQGQFQKYLHTLANIAKLLNRAEFRDVN